ncbi:MAG TPA: hypothetical protein VGP47_11165, partial [Parachlamydiaceae bacterium]|nr:hypothetical protein [Parachlamydiaceae bacterium]
MNILNSLQVYKNKSLEYYSQFNEIYKHTPSAYDVAIRTFQTSILVGVGAGAIPAGVCYLINTKLLVPITAIVSISTMLLRFKIKTFPSLKNEYVLNKLIAEQTTQGKHKVVLFCRQGSLDLTGAANTLSSNNIKIINDFSKTHIVVAKKIHRVDDINNAMQNIIDMGLEISDLWLSIHGGETSLELGKIFIKGRLNDDDAA